MERGCSRGCLNCSAPCSPGGPRPREQRGLRASAGLSPAGQQVELLAGKGVCWGRTVDGDCSGGSWASDRQREAAEPRLRQPARTCSEGT